QHMITRDCPTCEGKRLRREALAVTFAGLDVAAAPRLPMKELAALLRPIAHGPTAPHGHEPHRPERATLARRLAQGLVAPRAVLPDLGLGYLSRDRATPPLSPGELQRLRLATQVRSNLFGVVYVLDEPSAGLHPADTEALLRALEGLKAAGN